MNTPWKYEDGALRTKNGEIISEDICRTEGDFVVKCVNAHQELVHFVKEVQRIANDGMLTPEWANTAKHLLAKAEGVQS